MSRSEFRVKRGFRIFRRFRFSCSGYRFSCSDYRFLHCFVVFVGFQQSPCSAFSANICFFRVFGNLPTSISEKNARLRPPTILFYGLGLANQNVPSGFGVCQPASLWILATMHSLKFSVPASPSITWGIPTNFFVVRVGTHDVLSGFGFCLARSISWAQPTPPSGVWGFSVGALDFASRHLRVTRIASGRFATRYVLLGFVALPTTIS